MLQNLQHLPPIVWIVAVVVILAVSLLITGLRHNFNDAWLRYTGRGPFCPAGCCK